MTTALLVSGGIDSKVLEHMRPDYDRIHFTFDCPDRYSGSATLIDITTYPEKGEGMLAECIKLVDNGDYTNICYGYHAKNPEIDNVWGNTPDEADRGEQPLREWYKHDIIKYASENNIDLKDCISCLSVSEAVGSGNACGECYQCKEIEVAKQRLDSDGFDYSNVL